MGLSRNELTHIQHILQNILELGYSIEDTCQRNEAIKLVSIAKIGVIIQGPINARGRTINNLSPRNYDASKNINQPFYRVSKMGAHPILVTWDAEDTNKLDSDVLKLKKNDREDRIREIRLFFVRIFRKRTKIVSFKIKRGS